MIRSLTGVSFQSDDEETGSHAGALRGQEQLPLQKVFTMSMVSSGGLAFTPKEPHGHSLEYDV